MIRLSQRCCQPGVLFRSVTSITPPPPTNYSTKAPPSDASSTMPPPQMKSATFQRPSLLTLNPKSAKDPSTIMIPTPLRKTLVEQSSTSNVSLIHLFQFGYLYTATSNQIHEYEQNLLETATHKFYICYKLGEDSVVQIAQKDFMDNAIYIFGIYSVQSMAQARLVAKEMEQVLGYEIQEYEIK